ncbi:hypothetical protein BZB76_1067 [Actinomadura pelletieri DSM 43383]|uniref:Uncharacterized protein n=1 Tax=Actinomadura pelletieri DSM 43383 TaxID=1120940 RepID=A0A495QZU7_9ACTN|nr:hypothetical protein [Actinomadura pelletieri]RKS79592.1 hypothetical protein BZB76_1067 [Actinomadura pelletieri DSM 43383]
MKGTFRLQRQTSRGAHFAEVTVDVTPAHQPEVVIGVDTFGWRREVYGPDAWPYTHDNDLQREAAEGAWYALHHLPEPSPHVRVLITEIINKVADTCPGDVKFAAANAVWRAIDQHPAAPSSLDKNGTPHFPHQIR